MYVRLASAWTDLSGAAHQAGDVVDIDVVTLAELEEQGVVDEFNSHGVETDGATESQAPQGLIGPGPTAPPADDPETIGPGPTVPPVDGPSTQSKIGPGPTAPPKG